MKNQKETCPVCNGEGKIPSQMAMDLGFIFGFAYTFREKIKLITSPSIVIETIYYRITKKNKLNAITESNK